uniref:PLDc_N domain-containing protein n=1 Tax=candidate division WOR-3 bacterium TaxID=2052148 RepID=A0A7C1SS24_UNCW3
MILICITVVIAAKVLWIWMLIDALIHETDECNMRLLWTLVIIFTHWLGALIYLLVRRPERIRKLGK